MVSTKKSSTKVTKRAKKGNQLQHSRTKQTCPLPEDDYLRMRIFTERHTHGWKPLEKTTKDYVVQLLNSGQSLILSRVAPDYQEEINLEMQDIRSRLIRKIHTVKAPAQKLTDYRKVMSQMKVLSGQRASIVEQEELLDRAVREEEKLLDDLEEEEDRLVHMEAADSVQGEQMTEIIQTKEPELDLPKYPEG